MKYSQTAGWQCAKVSHFICNLELEEACESSELGVSEMTNSFICYLLCGWELYQPAVVHPFSVKDMWLLET